jgi:hypothetical protein
MDAVAVLSMPPMGRIRLASREDESLRHSVLGIAAVIGKVTVEILNLRPTMSYGLVFDRQ